MSSRREGSGESSQKRSNPASRDQVTQQNNDRPRKRRELPEKTPRVSVETTERISRMDREDILFDPNRSMHSRKSIPQKRRSEHISRGPERRHTNSPRFQQPILSHRIIGRDVDINTVQIFELLPPPDPELHIRTWRCLNKVYPKASIVEMVTGLDRDEFMEFARIVITSLPVASVAEMRERGMMETIQRVTGLAIEGGSHQGYGGDSNPGCHDDVYDENCPDDESEYNSGPDDIEALPIPKRHPYNKTLPTGEISSDEPMDDNSSGNDSNPVHSRVVPEPRNHLRPKSRSKTSRISKRPVESLQQNDKLSGESVNARLPSVSVVPSSSALSDPNSRSPSNISTDEAEKSHEEEIRRFQESLTAAHSSLHGRRAVLKEGALDKHSDNAARLVGLFKYDALVKGVFDILQGSDRSIPSNNDYESQMLDADIPREIYRVIGQTDHKAQNTALSRFHEAHIYLDYNQLFEAETLRRVPLYEGAHTNRDNPAVASIKFDMACALTKLSRRDFESMETTDLDFCKTAITRTTNMRQYGLRIAAYTNAMGSPAALLIWPWMDIPEITRAPLHRLQHVFIDGVCRFVKGSNEFRAVKALINHLSTWFEGWVHGTISSKAATERLEAFLLSFHKDGSSLKEIDSGRLGSNSCDEADNELQQLISIFATIPRAGNSSYSTVGTAGHNMSLNITDIESLGSQKQLTERAIEAVLPQQNFPQESCLPARQVTEVYMTSKSMNTGDQCRLKRT